MAHYLRLWLTGTALLLLGVAAFNLVVDPYRLLQLVDMPGFNTVKPAAARYGAVAKAYQLPRIQARTLVLGNSRAEVGLDPSLPAWPSPPVYNAALPGTGTDTSLRYLQLALAASTGAGAGEPARQPRTVVWGIDVMDFLTDPAQPPLEKPSAVMSRWPIASGLPGVEDLQAQAQDLLLSTLTLDALFDSVQTLASQHDPYAVDLTPLGFNPMRDYLKISREEGYWNLFRQKDLGNISSYLRRPTGIFDASGSTSPAWEDLKEVLRLCRQHGIQLQLFSYPYHAHLLEAIRLTGHWDAFEAWKRTVVHLLAQEARENQAVGQPAFAFWDFSTFNALSTEPIPAPADRTTAMRWYWEAGHFKSALGDLLLARMLQHSDHPAGFGVLLTPDNVEAHIRAIRAQGAAYRQNHPQDLQALQGLLQQSRMR